MPPSEDKELLATIKSLHEQNPMLGLRGCRLGLMIPDFVKIQTRAILNAADRGREGRRPPDREDHDPARRPRERARGDARRCSRPRRKAVEAAGGIEVDYKFGTMIEVPRGALTADEIAREADFFSFGTNDLTQMTFGYSRDDAEGGFLLKYVEDKILPVNPFQTLDDAVAGLMKIAVDKGRATKPGPRARDLRRARRRSGVDRASASGSASITCRARRSASPSPGLPRRRRSSPAPRRATRSHGNRGGSDRGRAPTALGHR